jgi:RecB family exonuclease
MREVALDSSALIDCLVLHPAERDLQAIAQVAKTGTGDLTWLRRVHPGLEASLRAELARSGWRDRQRLTAWDGLVDPALANAWLASRSLAQPAAGEGLNLSASSLETYVRCSFQFWNRYVLRLESEPPSETRLELDALESGALYHELLAELYRRLERDGLIPLEPSRLEAARLRLGDLFEELRHDPPWIAHEMPPALWALWRERAAADFEVLLERDAAESASGWRPARFELPFGGADDPVVVEVGVERLTTRGAIDRLDVRAGGGVRVVDYKTGKLKTEHTPDPPALKGRLQAPLYARVVEALRTSGRLPEASGPISALYLGVQAGSGYRRVEWTPEALAEAAPELERVLAGIRRGISEGEFFQVERDHLCTLCEFTDICGPGRQSRLAAKENDQRVVNAAAWREPGS